jgi:DNA-directed RNA polymerase subunit RPC12/RpoP
MSFHENTAGCYRCQKQVLVRAKATNHIFHLLMTASTLGLWLFVWIYYLAFHHPSYRCTYCGNIIPDNMVGKIFSPDGQSLET